MHVYTVQFISRVDDYKLRNMGPTWETTRVSVFKSASRAYMAACGYLAKHLLDNEILDDYDYDYDSDGASVIPEDKGKIEQYFREKLPDSCEGLILVHVLSCGGSLKNPQHAYEVLQDLIPTGEYIIDARTEEVRVERQNVQ